MLLILDSLTHPYAGIVHDGRLYALQALSHLHPGRYDKDLFFLFGSQDAYTVFSPIYGVFIESFGLLKGTFVLYIISKIFFLGSVLLFFRTLSRNVVAAFLAAVILASNPIHYIFFDVNEPFLTPRLLAQGFSLLALAAAITGSERAGKDGREIDQGSGKKMRSFAATVVLLMASGLFHPIMALGACIAVVLLWLVNREWLPLVVSLLVLAGVLGVIFVLKADLLFNLNPLMKFDVEWRSIVFERSPYLFPSEWQKEEWGGILSSALVCIAAYPFLSPSQQRVIAALLLTSLGGVAAAAIFTYQTELALPFQLQLWRSFWLLRVLNPLVCLLWGYILWHDNSFFRKFAAPMVVIPASMDGGITLAELYWLVPVILLSLLPGRFERDLTQKTRNVLWLILACCILLILVPTIFVNLQVYADHMQFETMIPFIVEVSGPAFAMISMFFIIYMFVKLAVSRVVIVSSALILLSLWPGMNYSTSYLSQLEPGRSLLKDNKIDLPFRDWAEIVEPGSLIMASNKIPVEISWFIFHSSHYFSRLQGAGILFNRKLAIEYERRRNIMKSLLESGDEYTFSVSSRQGTKIDYVITRGALPLKKIGESAGYKVYTTSSPHKRHNFQSDNLSEN